MDKLNTAIARLAPDVAKLLREGTSDDVEFQRVVAAMLAVAGELTVADALEILDDLFPPEKDVADRVTARSTTKKPALSIGKKEQEPHYATL